MAGTKTNERPGTRAQVKNYPMSASKARVVLDLIRGEDVAYARDILSGTEREAADAIMKVLNSAIANAVNNDGLQADELYVAAAYADEGPTMKRFTPRARGRAGRIRKRSCHITVIVARLDEDRLAILRAARSAQAAANRSRRVAGSRKPAATTTATPATDTVIEETTAPVIENTTTDETIVDEVATDEVTTDENATATAEGEKDGEEN
jgi:large subunit ribosomal protein L22